MPKIHITTATVNALPIELPNALVKILVNGAELIASSLFDIAPMLATLIKT